jgi:hypothetical protein
MNKKAINKGMAGFFAVAISVFVFSIAIVVVADESKAATDSDAQQQSYIENPGEIGDLARRAERQVEEVNEAYELEKEKLEAVKREQYFEDYKDEPAGSLLSKDDIAALETRRAQEENAIRTKAGYQIESLEADQTPRQEVPKAGPSLRSSSQASRRGVVKGIVFYENKGAALIAGEVVRENDMVMGVKVVNILPDYVEFEKKGNHWKQQVGQFPPPAVWEQPQPQQSPPAQRSSANPKTKK